MKSLTILFLILCSDSLYGQISNKVYVLDDVKAKVLVAKVLKAAPVIDGHNDLYAKYFKCYDCPPFNFYCNECPRDIKDYPLDFITTGHTDIPRWHKGGVGGTLLNVADLPPGSLQNVINLPPESLLNAYDLLYRLQDAYSNDLEIVGTSAQMRNAMRKGKIALLPSLEYAIRLSTDMSVLRMYYKLGLRSVTFAYQTNELADGSNDTARHSDISAFGRAMVKEMNRLGILIDLAHTSEKAMLDLIEASEAPVIISHTNLRTIVDAKRNATDKVLLQLKKKNGIVMLSFFPRFVSNENAQWATKTFTAYRDFLVKNNNDKMLAGELTKRWMQDNPEPQVPIAVIADNFDYAKKLIGAEYIGIGSDFDGMPFKTAVGLEDVSKIPNLLIELARRGWTENELRKISSENFFRVFEAVEKVAQQKRLTTEPLLEKLEKKN